MISSEGQSGHGFHGPRSLVAAGGWITAVLPNGAGAQTLPSTGTVLPPPSVKTLDIGGTQLDYVEQGQGTPVIFVHGGAGDWRTWEPLRPAIAAKHRFISYSRRYHWPNDPSGAGKPYTVPEQASDLIAFIQALGAGPVHVVGGSYGARVVLEAAVRRPDVFKTAAPSEAFVTGPSLWRFCAVWQAKQLADDLARIGVPMQKVDTVAATAQMVNAVHGDPTAWDRLEPERRQRFLDNQTFLRHQRPLDAVPSVGRAALRGFQRTALLVPGQCWRRGAANS